MLTFCTHKIIIHKSLFIAYYPGYMRLYDILKIRVRDKYFVCSNFNDFVLNIYFIKIATLRNFPKQIFFIYNLYIQNVP